MAKPLFGPKTASSVQERPAIDEIWDLPDMEPAVPTVSPPDTHRSPTFRYEEVSLPPAGVFTAELVNWRPLEAGRILWRFHIVPDSDYQELSREPVHFLTGTVFRPENNLCSLMIALEVIQGIQRPEEMAEPSVRARLRDAVARLDPDLLIGRRCRVEVEHLQDELGDVTARVRRITPSGWM